MCRCSSSRQLGGVDVDHITGVVVEDVRCSVVSWHGRFWHWTHFSDCRRVDASSATRSTARGDGGRMQRLQPRGEYEACVPPRNAASRAVLGESIMASHKFPGELALPVSLLGV